MKNKIIILVSCLLWLSIFLYAENNKTKSNDPFELYYGIEWVEDCNLDVWHWMKIEKINNKPYINFQYGFSESEWKYILDTKKVYPFQNTAY